MDTRVNKLPVWAQEHIENLQRERDNAARARQETLDTQTPSPIYAEDLDCISDGGPTPRRIYLQAFAVVIEAHGVRLRVSTQYGQTNDNSISMQWEDTRRRMREIAFIPLSFQNARLISKGNMR